MTGGGLTAMKIIEQAGLAHRRSRRTCAGSDRNSAAGRQLEHGGIIDLFERRFSVDETVRRHKPALAAYHSVAAALELDPGDICLIASHVWDTIGAVAAGWQAALILREGNAPLDVGPQPDYIGKDLDAVADQLIERYAPAASASRPGH